MQAHEGDHVGLQAVLWDMDGTIVDTEPLWFAAEHALVTSHGGTWSQELGDSLVGGDLTDVATGLQGAGVDLPVPDIIDHLEGTIADQIPMKAQWRPGARELLASLNQAGIRCALITMAWRRTATAVLQALPADSFELILTGEDVSRGKPHPDPYLEGLAALGLAAADCVAIEDSPTGSAAAAAAGLCTLVVPHSVPVDPAPGMTIIDSLTQITPQHLADLPART